MQVRGTEKTTKMQEGGNAGATRKQKAENDTTWHIMIYRQISCVLNLTNQLLPRH